MTSDPKKKITNTRSTNHQHLPCTLDDLLKDVVTLKDSQANDSSPTEKRIQDILITINNNAQVIEAYLKDKKQPPKWIQTESKLYTQADNPEKVYEEKKNQGY